MLQILIIWNIQVRNSEKQNKRPPFALPTLKQLLGEVFCDIQNNEGRGKVLSAELKAEAVNTYGDLYYSGIHKNRS